MAKVISDKQLSKNIDTILKECKYNVKNMKEVKFKFINTGRMLEIRTDIMFDSIILNLWIPIFFKNKLYWYVCLNENLDKKEYPLRLLAF